MPTARAMRARLGMSWSPAALALTALGCGSITAVSTTDGGGGAGGIEAGGTGGGQPDASDGQAPGDAAPTETDSSAGSGGSPGDGGPSGTGGAGGEAFTCVQAAATPSNLGCEFWPTITANPVWIEFDPAVMIANGQSVAAAVSIDGPAGFHKEVTVGPGQQETVLLAWVADLKGPEFSTVNTSGGRLTSSTRADRGAYHLKSSVPVTVWQWNPLQHAKPQCLRNPAAVPCLSASVDASLLLPVSAMSGSYRVFAYAAKNGGPEFGSVPGGMAITATADGTTVRVQLGRHCGVEIFPTPTLGTCVAASLTGDIPARLAGETYTLTMNAGDVVQLVGAWSAFPGARNADVSGSVVSADKPVQVISFNAIAQVPDDSVASGDHMEETVPPSETLGNTYIVVPPPSATGQLVGHVVRIHGNVNGTKLTYPEGKPPGAPDTIDAGDVAQIPPLAAGQPTPDCTTVAGRCVVSQPFIVEADGPILVTSFLVGASLQPTGPDASKPRGDPAMTLQVPSAQFRRQYTFAVPVDYPDSFADILVPRGAAVLLDGATLAEPPRPIGRGDWGLARARLGAGKGGFHTVSTSHNLGVGLQVTGFAVGTAYAFPGGYNASWISRAIAAE